jgi:WD40 repeat protein
MKCFKTILILILAANFVFAQNNGEFLKFTAKVGFTKKEDSIITYKFFDEGKKVALVGEKNLQIWDVENAKLLNSIPHQIPQFAPKGVLNFVLLGVPLLLNWQPFFIDPDGKWIITIERPGDKKPKTIVVRDLQSSKPIKTLETPNVSIDYLSFDPGKNEINTYGELDGVTVLAKWDKDTLELKKSVTVNNYKWSQFIKNDEKILVGTGNAKQNSADPKQGAGLTLRDAKTGAVEKEYSAQNLLPGTIFERAEISGDEKFLMARCDNRIFVWETDGNGAPRFEIAPQNPKEDFERVDIAGGQFIVVSVDKKLRIYDLAGDGTPKYELVSAKPNDSVRLFGETADGKYIAVADDQKVSVLETGGSGKPAFEIARQSEKERFTTIIFTDDDQLLAVGRVNSSEKQPERTEFYNTATGKLVFTAPFGVGGKVFFTSDKKYLYTESLGSAAFLNIAEQKSFILPLGVHYPDTSGNAVVPVYDSPYNIEDIVLSPNEKMILKYGDDRVSVFDIETGKELQTVFDPEKVKYDKQNRVKKSGLSDAGWTSDGKYLFAFDKGSFFTRYRTVSFWQILK